MVRVHPPLHSLLFMLLLRVFRVEPEDGITHPRACCLSAYRRTPARVLAGRLDRVERPHLRPVEQLVAHIEPVRLEATQPLRRYEVIGSLYTVNGHLQATVGPAGKDNRVVHGCCNLELL